jgi:hypothetical protein
MATTPKINEKTSFQYAGQIQDAAGTDQLLSATEAILLTVYDANTKTVLRATQDARNTNQVSIDSAGAITYNVRPYGTRIANAAASAGEAEEHRLLFRFVWNSAGGSTLTNGYATTDASKTVTVTHGAHGLAVNDHVVFLGGDEVGGLNMQGLHLLTSVIDSNTYTITHSCIATSTESGGGSVTTYDLPETSTHIYKFKVVKQDVVC